MHQKLKKKKRKQPKNKIKEDALQLGSIFSGREYEIPEAPPGMEWRSHTSGGSYILKELRADSFENPYVNRGHHRQEDELEIFAQTLCENLQEHEDESFVPEATVGENLEVEEEHTNDVWIEDGMLDVPDPDEAPAVPDPQGEYIPDPQADPDDAQLFQIPMEKNIPDPRDGGYWTQEVCPRGQVACKHWLWGSCSRGNWCTFWHERGAWGRNGKHHHDNIACDFFFLVRNGDSKCKNGALGQTSPHIQNYQGFK
jgi:hypothetical protein